MPAMLSAALAILSKLADRDCTHNLGLRVLTLLGISAISFAAGAAEITLTHVAIAVDRSEPSYVHYGAQDLGSYLTELTGQRVRVSSSARRGPGASTVIAIGA
jgi:hypothetical protein